MGFASKRLRATHRAAGCVETVGCVERSEDAPGQTRRNPKVGAAGGASALHLTHPMLWGVALSAVIFSAAEGADPRGVEFFEAKVRPVLVARCYKCHSHEAEVVQGGLLLDSRAGWTKGGDSGPAIVPGDHEGSRLARAVRYADDALQMPPEGKLDQSEIDVLVEWVRMGAPDPRGDGPATKAQREINLDEERKHWTYQPLADAQPPEVADASWCRTPIDRFVLAKLEAAGIRPNGSANRRKLIRRAYFGLVGLPPPPEEVEAFAADTDSAAYERLIDRLLASPHYGERWGRHWLDLARFAESHGFEHDYDRPSAYHYRDFVIKALNDDLPYDTFVKWQIAGDEFEPDNALALMATGFLAAGVHNTQITKNQVEKERYDELDDMAATLGTAVLGLTVGCARCHDHKFDPIPTRDYYRLIANFTTTVRSEVELDLQPEAYAKEKTAFDAAHAPLVEALDRHERVESAARLDEWLKNQEHNTTAATWLVLDTFDAHAQSRATFKRLDDDSLLVEGPNADADTYTIHARTNRSGITAVWVEALAHESLKSRGPGRAENGNFALSDFKLHVRPLEGEAEPVAVSLVNPRATFEQNGLSVAAAIDGDAKTAWAIDPKFGADHAAVFEVETPIGTAEGAQLTFTLTFENNKNHGIGRLRLSITTAPPPAALDGIGEPQAATELAGILAASGGVPNDAQKDSLRYWHRRLDPRWRELRRAVDEHARTAPQPKLTKVLVASEGLPAIRLHTQGEDFFPVTYFLQRGDPQRKQEAAAPGFLQVLLRTPAAESHWQSAPPAGSRTSFRRRALAEWITDTQDGAGALAARVIANRLWQHHFGRGIVGTPSDFGTQGQRPTHPELLDWLAAELIRGGWRLKPLHRLIMTSGVYMQDGAYDAERAALDRDNLLLWRRQPHRLEAEVIRDALLSVSGQLDTTMFGPGTLDNNHRRRSLYFTMKRSQLVPMMVLFDGPDALQGIAARSATTIAPQALSLMNNSLVRQCAERMAARIGKDAQADSRALVRAAYLLALSRPPSDDELAESLAFIDQQARSYADAEASLASARAWADFCQVLMGSTEFVYVE